MTDAAVTTRIGTFVFDVVMDESHHSELKVTDNPVESGSQISDHAILMPRPFEVTGTIAATATMNDAEYRGVIRSRCIKNFSRCNLDSAELACEMLFGAKGYSIEVIGPWHWEITTTGADRFILFCAQSLDVLPRASGMNYTFVEK